MIPAEDNLQEARSRMHKLLDEAFSLISPRSSFTEREFRSVLYFIIDICKVNNDRANNSFKAPSSKQQRQTELSFLPTKQTVNILLSPYIRQNVQEN